MEGFARLPVEIRNIIKKKIVQAEEESFIEWWWTVVSLASEFNGEESPLRACFLIGSLKLAINDPFAEVCLRGIRDGFNGLRYMGFVMRCVPDGGTNVILMKIIL